MEEGTLERLANKVLLNRLKANGRGDAPLSVASDTRAW
jgi:hypothetical protein